MPTGLDGPLEEPKIQWSCANYFYPGRYCICRQSDILSHVTGGVNLEVMYLWVSSGSDVGQGVEARLATERSTPSDRRDVSASRTKDRRNRDIHLNITYEAVLKCPVCIQISH